MPIFTSAYSEGYILSLIINSYVCAINKYFCFVPNGCYSLLSLSLLNNRYSYVISYAILQDYK